MDKWMKVIIASGKVGESLWGENAITISSF